MEISSTRNKIGQYYSDRQKWAKAAQYYTQVGLTVLLMRGLDHSEHTDHMGSCLLCLSAAASQSICHMRPRHMCISVPVKLS